MGAAQLDGSDWLWLDRRIPFRFKNLQLGDGHPLVNSRIAAERVGDGSGSVDHTPSEQAFCQVRFVRHAGFLEQILVRNR